MKCEVFSNLMSEYYDGDTAKELLQAMAQHIKDCGDCRKEYSRFKTTISHLGKLRTVEAPPGLNFAIKASLVREGLLPSPSRWMTRRAVNRVAAVAAVFMLFIIVATQAPWLEPDSNSTGFYPPSGSYVRPVQSDYLDPNDLVHSRDIKQPVLYGNGYFNPNADIVE